MLAKNPARSPVKALAAPIRTYGAIEWHQSVGARMPHPDETATLQLDQPAALLITQRATAATSRQPLAIETTAALTDIARYTYTPAPGSRSINRGP